MSDAEKTREYVSPQTGYGLKLWHRPYLADPQRWALVVSPPHDRMGEKAVMMDDIVGRGVALLMDAVQGRQPYAPDERRPPVADPQPAEPKKPLNILDEPDVRDNIVARVKNELGLDNLSDGIFRNIRSADGLGSWTVYGNAGAIARIELMEQDLRKLRSERNARDEALCSRIQKAEARIRELEAEDRPALVGQRDAWRDIANRLHDILKNR